jgi:hypothetical protein
MTAAISGTPLAEILGLKRGIRVWFHNMPASVHAEIDPDAIGVEEQACASDGMQGACLFITERGHLEREVGALGPLLATHGFIWVFWPMAPPAELTAAMVRTVALPAGLVDSDTCTIGAEWDGLKLMARRPA